MNVDELQKKLDQILDQPMLDGDDLDRRIPALVGQIERQGGTVDRAMLEVRGIALDTLKKQRP